MNSNVLDKMFETLRESALEHGVVMIYSQVYNEAWAATGTMWNDSSNTFLVEHNFRDSRSHPIKASEFLDHIGDRKPSFVDLFVWSEPENVQYRNEVADSYLDRNGNAVLVLS